MNASSNDTIAYFGYGSLVNLKTLQTPYLSAHPARLTGWERVWLERPAHRGDFGGGRRLAFLSVRRNPNAAIDGMLVVDHKASLAALDQREALYSRHQVEEGALKIHGGNTDAHSVENTYVYVADANPAEQGASIVRSYLDAVMQGYLTHFDSDGLHRFMESTSGFSCGIIEDRDEPIYPRAVTITDTERRLFDQLI